MPDTEFTLHDLRTILEILQKSGIDIAEDNGKTARRILAGIFTKESLDKLGIRTDDTDSDSAGTDSDNIVPPVCYEVTDSKAVVAAVPVSVKDPIRVMVNNTAHDFWSGRYDIVDGYTLTDTREETGVSRGPNINRDDLLVDSTGEVIWDMCYVDFLGKYILSFKTKDGSVISIRASYDDLHLFAKTMRMVKDFYELCTRHKHKFSEKCVHCNYHSWTGTNSASSSDNTGRVK